VNVYGDPMRLWARLLRRVVRTESGCWQFTGSVNSSGYSSVGAGKRSRTILGHQLAVIVRDGGIPDGLTVDHSCHDAQTCGGGRDCQHRRCVNPAHLVVMTGGDNSARRWESGLCAQGHPLAWRKRGDGKARYCPECTSAKHRTNSGRTSSDYWRALRESKTTDAA